MNCIWTCTVLTVEFGYALLRRLCLDMHCINCVWSCTVLTGEFGHTCIDSRVWTCIVSTIVLGYALYRSLTLDVRFIDDCVSICIVSTIVFGYALFHWLSLDVHCIDILIKFGCLFADDLIICISFLVGQLKVTLLGVLSVGSVISPHPHPLHTPRV